MSEENFQEKEVVIAKWDFDFFYKKFEKLVKKAAKHKVFFKYSHVDIDIKDDDENLIPAVKFKIEWSQPEISIPGWTYLATVENDGVIAEDGTPIYNIKSLLSEEDKAGISFSDFIAKEGFVCHHCNTNRKRKKVHIFRKDDTQELKMFATSCVQPYFGINVLNQVENIFSVIDGITEMFEEEEGNFGGMRVSNDPTFKDNLNILKSILYSIFTLKGYVKNFGDNVSSGSLADDYKWMVLEKPNAKAYPTAPTNKQSFFKEYKNEAEFEEWMNENFNDINEIKKEIISFWGNEWKSQKSNDFINNIYINLIGPKKSTAILCWATFSFLKDQKGFFQTKVVKEEKKKSEKHIGTIKERIQSMKVFFQDVRTFTNDWGVNYIYKFVDAEGNNLTWFTQNNNDFEDGQELEIAFTPKSHDYYQGECQTVVTRLKVK